MRVDIPIATGFYEDSAKPIAYQQCINLIPKFPETQGLSQGQLKAAPGLSFFATCGNKSNRGAHVMDGVPYFVNGQNLYRVNSDGTSDNLGDIAGVNRVSMADNGKQLCIVVPDNTGYIFTDSPDTLTEITDVNYVAIGPSKQVEYKDGYFIHISKEKFYISNLNNGLVYNALDFGTAEVDPDNNNAIHVNRNVLYIGGNETIEAFQNIGGADFPFQRIQGAVVQKGIKAKFSVVDFDNSFVFLGAGTNEQPAIWRFTGSSAIKISTQAIDDVIALETDSQLAAVYATTHAIDGGYFVTFHFHDTSFTHDAVASANMGRPIWHERQSRSASGTQTAWRVASLVKAYGTFLVGDRLGASVGELSRSNKTEYGTLIDRDFSTISASNNGLPFFINQAELTTESGNSGENITMSLSTDGGYTFSNELALPLGGSGQYRDRQIWRRLGRADRFVLFKFSLTDDAALIKLELDIS